MLDLEGLGSQVLLQITLDFTSHIVSYSSISCWYFWLFSDAVAVTWDCLVCCGCPFLLLVNHHSVWLTGQQLLDGPELEVPQDVCSIVFNQFSVVHMV